MGEIDRAYEWAEVLEVVAGKVAALRSATSTGRPWGEEEFLLQLSAATGRELYSCPLHRQSDGPTDGLQRKGAAQPGLRS